MWEILVYLFYFNIISKISGLATSISTVPTSPISPVLSTSVNGVIDCKMGTAFDSELDEKSYVQSIGHYILQAIGHFHGINPKQILQTVGLNQSSRSTGEKLYQK